MIQLFSNSLGEEELEEIKKVFKSRWIGQGEQVKLFEKEFGERIGSKNILMTNSCTAALFMSMEILDIGPGDEVILPSISFPSVANAVIKSGATPVFCDVHHNNLNIDCQSLYKKITNKTKAVIILHYGGWPASMSTLKQLADEHNFYIIEDNANSIISKYNNEYCGTIGDIGCYSFDSMKILSTGDGGAIHVKNDELFEKAKLVRYMGIMDAQSGIDSSKEGKEKWWEFQIEMPANRYTTNDIVATIARVQLKKLDYFIDHRKFIWDVYSNEFLQMNGVEFPIPNYFVDVESSYYLYWLQFDTLEIRNKVARHLVDNGIYCTFRYYPLHLIDFYQKFCPYEELPSAEYVNNHTINIPLHQNLTYDEAKFIIETVKKYV
jgi:aminotransferase